MPPISDVVKFAILQVAVICSIFLALDLFKLINAVVFDGLGFSRVLTILAVTRGSGMALVAFVYAFFCGVFYSRFATLQLLEKEAICLLVMFTASALSCAVYPTPWFKFVLTGNRITDFAILYAGLYIFFRVVFVVAQRVESKKKTDSD